MLIRQIYNPLRFDSDFYGGVIITSALETWLKERDWIPQDEEVISFEDDGDSIEVELLFEDKKRIYYIEKTIYQP